MSDLEGVMLSEYLLLQCVSKGGVADVYRARQNGDENYEVAVKVFRSGYAQRESFRNYFMTEAEKIGRFEHPNILPFLEFGEGEELLYVVTPFVASGTLENLLGRVGGKFSALQALPIMQQLCSAVQYAHNADVIHGNIKPTNVFVATDGHMLLTDFGIARGYDDSQQSLTRIGWGSAEYAAPEQSLGVLRQASDIYALGVLLFRLLTGQPPFTGQTPVEVLLKHVRQQPPSARMLVPDISVAVEDVLYRAIQKRSDDRFASVEELSQALLAAVTIAPVASSLAQAGVVQTPQPAYNEFAPMGNPQTPIADMNFSFPDGQPQTPVPTSFTFPAFTFSAPAPEEPLQQPPSTGNLGSATVPADGTEKGKTGSLAETMVVGKHMFWSVDPVEWSPVTAAPQEEGSVPLTADAYLQTKPLVPEVLSSAPESSSPVQKAENKERNAFSEGLRKALPMVVVILLLLGLCGALLSSFFYS